MPPIANAKSLAASRREARKRARDDHDGSQAPASLTDDALFCVFSSNEPSSNSIPVSRIHIFNIQDVTPGAGPDSPEFDVIDPDVPLLLPSPPPDTTPTDGRSDGEFCVSDKMDVDVSDRLDLDSDIHPEIEVSNIDMFSSFNRDLTVIFIRRKPI